MVFVFDSIQSNMVYTKLGNDLKQYTNPINNKAATIKLILVSITTRWLVKGYLHNELWLLANYATLRPWSRTQANVKRNTNDMPRQWAGITMDGITVKPNNDYTTTNPFIFFIPKKIDNKTINKKKLKKKIKLRRYHDGRWALLTSRR